jgi:hypothetical protein
MLTRTSDCNARTPQSEHTPTSQKRFSASQKRFFYVWFRHIDLRLYMTSATEKRAEVLLRTQLLMRYRATGSLILRKLKGTSPPSSDSKMT